MAQNYDRPTEEMILEEYLKAVPALTIQDDPTVLSKELVELKKANEDSSLIKARLDKLQKEKELQDAEMNAMREQMDTFLKVIKNPHVRKKLLLVPEPLGLVQRKGLRMSKENLHNSNPSV